MIQSDSMSRDDAGNAVVVPHTIGHAAWADRPDPLPPIEPSGAPDTLAVVEEPEALISFRAPAPPTEPSRSPVPLSLSIVLVAASAAAFWWWRDRAAQPAIDARTRDRLRASPGSSASATPVSRAPVSGSTIPAADAIIVAS